MVWDVQLPVDRQKKSHLILVDLLDIEARDLAPGLCGVVPILQILGSQNQSSKKHTAPALETRILEAIARLFHGKVASRDMGLDQDQVVQCNRQGGITGTRALERLLDELAQGKSRVRSIAVARAGRRQGPNGFDSQGG